MSVRVPIRVRPASPPSSRMLSRGLPSQGSCGARLHPVRGRVEGGPGRALGLLLALEHRADQAGLLVGVARGDGQRGGDREGENADQDPAGGALGRADPAAECEVAGHHHPDPDHADHDQSHPESTQDLRVDRVTEQGLAVDRGVDGQREDGGGEQADDDAADDPAAGGDQADTGDRGANNGEQHRASKVVLGGERTLGRALRVRGSGVVPAPLLRRRGLA